MADEINYPVVLDLDEGSADKAADGLDDAITKAMNAAIQTFVKEFRKGISVIGKEFARDPGMRRFQTNLHGITEELQDTARASHRFAESFSSDLRALEARARATQSAIASSGNGAGLGASIETQLRKTLELQKDLERDSVELARNPQLVRAYENRGNAIRTALAQDVRFINRILENQTQQELAELNQRNAQALAASRERVAAVNADRSRNVVAQQREGALELEESRRTSRLKLQDERATARQRLAIIQATSQQIRALERGISATLRGVGSVLGGIANRVGRSTDQVAAVFRRGDAQINAGLQPALERRSSIFRRELRQTESIIQTSVVRQSRLFQQAEVQASRGLAGVASGRSQAGALLGGGLAIGGGFALITKLREGFQESVNLNESLNKTRAIFGDASDEILAFADTSVEALFVTKSAALEAAANFGIFGRSAGLAGPELAGFSKTLTVLATDLASFNNTSIADATTALSAALRGESEPIRKYGVLLDAATLEQRAFSDNITDTLRKLTPMERVLAANAEILAQTAVQQGDAARTADDFANSSRRAAAASTEFFASIAKFAVPFATILTNGILPLLVTLTALVNDEVTGALSVLRDGLIGAGAALGGLLAAKGTGEALKFLALGLKAVLTPVGLLVTAVSLVGAAVNILANRSPALRSALDRLRETVGDLVSSGLSLAADLFGRLSDAVVNRLLPAVTRLAQFLARNLQTAFRESVDFVENRVLPVLERFGRFLRDRVLPALLEFASAARDRIAQGLAIARDAAVSFFEAVQPFIAPLVEGFRNLGGAIRDAFGGDFGGALERLRTFGTQAKIIAGTIGVGIALALVNPLLGIGVTIAGVLGVAFGPRLLDVLRPQAERFGNFLSDIFSIDNLGEVGVGFLRVVRRIGEIIGGIVTDRRFVTALAAIAGAIAATAGAAIIGFADGVRANIPELIDLLGDALRLGFREAFKFALSDPRIIIGVIAGATVLGAIRRAFSAAGAAGASSFGGSFLAGTRSFFQTNAFAAGLFGGIGGLQAAATKQAQREASALTKARSAALRDLALLNVPLAPLTTAGGQILSGPGDPVRQLDQIKTKYTEAGVAGALFRENTTRAFGSLAQVAGGLGRAISGDIGGGLTQAAAGVSGFRSNVTQLFSRLRTDLRAAGIGLGAALGGAIASGIGAALSGQALGTSTSGTGRALGVAGIISSALFASAATGGNVGVGVAVTAVGLVTAALSRNEQTASEARDRIAEYTRALRDLKTPGEQAAFAIGTLSTRLDGVSEGALLLLQQAGINVTDLSVAFANGTLDAKALEDQILALPDAMQAGFEGARNQPPTSAAVEAIKFLTSAVSELQAAERKQPLLDSVRGTGVVRDLEAVQSRVVRLGSSLGELNASATAAERSGAALLDSLASDDRVRRLSEAGTSLDNIGTALDSLNQQRTDRINDEISKVSETLSGAQEAAGLAREAIASFFTGGFLDSASGQIDQLIGQVTGVGGQIGEAIQTGGEIGEAALRTTLASFGDQVGGILAKAFGENEDLDTAGALAQLQPLFDAIRQGAGLDVEDLFTDEAAQRLIDEITGKLQDGDFQAAVDFAQAADEEVARLQTELNRQRVNLNADIVFSGSQIRQALIEELGLSPAEAAGIFTNFGIIRERGEAEGAAIGAATADGMERAILAGRGQVDIAAAALGASAAAALRGELQISSPSQVFAGLGAEIPAGLAAGINGAVDRVEGSVQRLGSSVIEAFGGQSITDAISGFVTNVFDAVSALEDLEGVDLSRLIVGQSDATNQLSNAGQTANRFGSDLRDRFSATNPHPPGWIQTEDGTWVPPSFFAPPPSLGQTPPPFGDMREGAVAAQPMAQAVRIDQVHITEATNARATARETIMGLKTAAFTSQPLRAENRVPVDVGSG